MQGALELTAPVATPVRAGIYLSLLAALGLAGVIPFRVVGPRSWAGSRSWRVPFRDFRCCLCCYTCSHECVSIMVACACLTTTSVCNTTEGSPGLFLCVMRQRSRGFHYFVIEIRNTCVYWGSHMWRQCLCRQLQMRMYVIITRSGARVTRPEQVVSCLTLRFARAVVGSPRTVATCASTVLIFAAMSIVCISSKSKCASTRV